MQETNKVSRGKTIAKWGLILAIPLFLINFGVLQITPTSASNVSIGTIFIGILSFVFKAAIGFACAFLAAKEWRDKGLGGYISFGKAYLVSLLTGFAAAFILLAFSPLTLGKYNEQMQIVKEQQMDNLDKMGAPDQQFEFMEKVWDVATNPVLYYIATLIGYMVSAAIMALLGAAAAQKLKSVPINPQEQSQ